MEHASQLADQGDLAGGRAVLMRAKGKVQSSSSAQHTLSRNLCDEMGELETHFQSEVEYRSVGSKMSKMHAMSHSRQRAVHTNVGTYVSGAKRKAALKASWMSSIAAGEGSDSD